jgi:tRNA threonylcarbamoyladenosine biosynthesis protein TsaB
MLLALDTSTRTAGIALYDGVQILAETIWTSRDYHTRDLAPVVDEALQRSGIKMSALQAVGVATGPGSFTGLRIGLALAKGIAFGCRIPIIGIPTLDFLAAAQTTSELPLLAILHAGRGRLAVGSYHFQKGLWIADGKMEILDIESLSQRITRPTIVCGELTEAERQALARKRKNVILASPARSLRRPGYLAELAWRRWQAGQVDNPVTLAPLYLHVGEPIPG